MLENYQFQNEEINSLRIKIAQLHSGNKKEKLENYKKIFDRSILFCQKTPSQYHLKYQDAIEIIQLSSDIEEFKTAHEFYKIIYEDPAIDNSHFLYQEGKIYEKENNFENAFKLYSQIFKRDNIKSELRDQVATSLNSLESKLINKRDLTKKVIYEIEIDSESKEFIGEVAEMRKELDKSGYTKVSVPKMIKKIESSEVPNRVETFSTLSSDLSSQSNSDFVLNFSRQRNFNFLNSPNRESLPSNAQSEIFRDDETINLSTGKDVPDNIASSTVVVGASLCYANSNSQQQEAPFLLPNQERHF